MGHAPGAGLWGGGWGGAGTSGPRAGPGLAWGWGRGVGRRAGMGGGGDGAPPVLALTLSPRCSLSRAMSSSPAARSGGRPGER